MYSTFETIFGDNGCSTSVYLQRYCRIILIFASAGLTLVHMHMEMLGTHSYITRCAELRCSGLCFCFPSSTHLDITIRATSLCFSRTHCARRTYVIRWIRLLHRRVRPRSFFYAVFIGMNLIYIIIPSSACSRDGDFSGVIVMIRSATEQTCFK